MLITKRSMVVAAPALVLATATQAEAKKAECESKRCVERVAMRQCSNARPVPCLRCAALHWRVSFDVLHRKARCESRMDPHAYFPMQSAQTAGERTFAWVNGRALGLLAFKPGTWGTTPYAKRSPWDAKWSALAGGYMHAVGRGREWACP